MRGEALVENASDRPEDEIHFTLARDFATRIDVPGASLVKDDEGLSYRVFRFEPPLQPGEKRTLRFEVRNALRNETPPELQYLLKDLFEDITLFSNRTLEATARKRSDGRFEVAIDVEARKFKADAKGAETEAPLDDWIEIGAFAKPQEGSKYGKTLYRQRVHLKQARSSHTFTVDEAPEQAGIDPFLLLVDRVPEDNLKAVSPATGAGE